MPLKQKVPRHTTNIKEYYKLWSRKKKTMWPVANHFELQKLSFIKISPGRISTDAKFLVTNDKNKRKKFELWWGERVGGRLGMG